MITPCPYLPEPDPDMDWRSLKSSRTQSCIQFYVTALKYAQLLWMRDLQARALLAVDRALLTDLTGKEPELLEWPLPYQAMAWMVGNYREETFVGNPRVHFQHLASRIRGERDEQRRWRAWACWYLTRQVKPDLPGDDKQGIAEPDFDKITRGLAVHGIPGEVEILRSVVEGWR